MDLQMIISSIIQVFQPLTFLFLLVGFFVGVIFGAMPGLTSTLAIALLLPMTYSMPLTQALVMCIGVYMAGIYSGCITAITINIPGTPGAVMTSVEGNAMMRRGEGARAIGHATIASSFGGALGALFLIFISPLAAKLALLVKTPGKFSLVLFALVVMVIISENKRKAIVTLSLGLICATIGVDQLKAVSRFTFGFTQLIEGIDTTTLIVGCFALSEIFSQALINNTEYKAMTSAIGLHKYKRKDFFPSWSEIKEVGLLTYIRSTLVGFFIGILPGAGASMASFVSYATAKSSSKEPEKFGTGHPTGIAAPEAANNAVCGGALVPMLTLGIPGDGTTAVLLGVFLVYGIVPGPNLLTERMADLGPMFIALFICAAVLMPLSLYLFGPYYLKIASINRVVLYSTIALIAILGVFAATASVFQMGIALVVGIVMFILKRQGYPPVPFILGVILGPICEQYLRTTLTLGHGNPMIFLTEPDSLFFIIITIIFVILLPILNKKSATTATASIKDTDENEVQ